MARQNGAGLVQRRNVFQIEIFLHSQESIESRTGMPLRHHQTISVFHSRVGWIYVHLFIIEDDQHINDGERTTDMTLAKTADHLDYDTSRPLGKVF